MLPKCVGELDDSLLMLEAVLRGAFVALRDAVDKLVEGARESGEPDE